MIFEYRCGDCGELMEAMFRIGEAADEVECESCGGLARRAFTSCNFDLKGSGWPSKTLRQKSDMTARNARAGRRMRKEHGEPGMRLSALDYGGGDIREVKKGG